MGILSDLLKKDPQSVKDKYKMKIREKAIERTKEKIIKHNKTVDDYSDITKYSYCINSVF